MVILTIDTRHGRYANQIVNHLSQKHRSVQVNASGEGISSAVWSAYLASQRLRIWYLENLLYWDVEIGMNGRSSSLNFQCGFSGNDYKPIGPLKSTTNSIKLGQDYPSMSNILITLDKRFSNPKISEIYFTGLGSAIPNVIAAANRLKEVRPVEITDVDIGVRMRRGYGETSAIRIKIRRLDDGI